MAIQKQLKPESIYILRKEEFVLCFMKSGFWMCFPNMDSLFEFLKVTGMEELTDDYFTKLCEAILHSLLANPEKINEHSQMFEEMKAWISSKLDEGLSLKPGVFLRASSYVDSLLQALGTSVYQRENKVFLCWSLSPPASARRFYEGGSLLSVDIFENHLYSVQPVFWLQLQSLRSLMNETPFLKSVLKVEEVHIKEFKKRIRNAIEKVEKEINPPSNSSPNFFTTQKREPESSLANPALVKKSAPSFEADPHFLLFGKPDPKKEQLAPQENAIPVRRDPYSLLFGKPDPKKEQPAPQANASPFSQDPYFHLFGLPDPRLQGEAAEERGSETDVWEEIDKEFKW